MKSGSQEIWVVKMITGNLKAQHDRRGENIMIAPPHPPPTPHPLHPLPNTSKKHKTSHQKRDNPACVPAKMKLIFLQPSQNTAPATQMHVLKFIGGRRLKCIFFGVKIEKNAFRLHKMQISKVTYGNFSNVCGYIHIYIYSPKRKCHVLIYHSGIWLYQFWKHGPWTWAYHMGGIVKNPSRFSLQPL